MFGLMFFSLLNAQHQLNLTPRNDKDKPLQNSYFKQDDDDDNDEFWKLEGNENIDSTKHFLGTKDFNPLIVKTNATERMRITSSGNIGIGTAVPNYPFEVQVPAFVKTLSADYVHVSKGLTIGDLHFCRGNNCSVDTVHTTQQRDLLLRSNNLLGLIADTVKVASPVTNSTRFQIDGSVATRDLYLNSPSIQQGELLMLDSVSNKIVGVNLKLAGTLAGGQPSNLVCTSEYVVGWVYPVSQIALKQDGLMISKYPLKGNVGIGVCVSTAKLHVRDLDENPNLFLVESERNGQINSHFVITKETKVGIGTATPQANLEIAGSNNQASLLVKHGNSTGFVVTDQGVGVGTMPTPQYSMSVCGSIHAQEVVVDPPGWCDYVFEDDYELMPWDSLMEFVRTHKHLPGVPSAENVESQGIPVGEMSKIFLQKIEELVLYNEELRKKMIELEEKIKELEKLK